MGKSRFDGNQRKVCPPHLRTTDFEFTEATPPLVRCAVQAPWPLGVAAFGGSTALAVQALLLCMRRKADGRWPEGHSLW
jgi:hypothetical protein